MTLLDMANFICDKVNQAEAEDVASCKGFLSRNWQIIWQNQLWKDSLVEFTQTLSSQGYTVNSSWLPTKRTLLCPAQIANVVAVRTDKRKLDIESSERFYRQDFDAFQNAGDAMQYRLLFPVAWELDAATHVGITITPIAGNVSVFYLAADGITVSRFDASAQGFSGDMFTSRIDSLAKATGFVLTLTASATYPPTAPITTIDALVVYETGVSVPRRQRVQLIGNVSDGVVIRVLGKLVCPGLTADSDEPTIAGVESCLIKFSQGDMLERERQYGKANVCKQEAVALLEQLKREQSVQQAFNKRFIPSDGFGGVNDYLASNGSLQTL